MIIFPTSNQPFNKFKHLLFTVNKFERCKLFNSLGAIKFSIIFNLFKYNIEINDIITFFLLILANDLIIQNKIVVIKKYFINNFS
jgi:hypothetical protein